MPSQPVPQKPSFLESLTFGQVALFFPAFHVFNFVFLQGGGLPRLFHNLFEPKTADEFAANREGFVSCFRSPERFGACLAPLIVLILGAVLFDRLKKGSIVANWVNVSLAAAAALAIVLVGKSAAYNWILAGGWLVLATIGLFTAYERKAAPPAR